MDFGSRLWGGSSPEVGLGQFGVDCRDVDPEWRGLRVRTRKWYPHVHSHRQDQLQGDPDKSGKVVVLEAGLLCRSINEILAVDRDAILGF